MSHSDNEKAMSDVGSVDIEKSNIQQVEHAGAERVIVEAHIDPVLEKQTMRKVDYRLIPILGALYSFSLIDRTNLGLAYVAGLGRQLQLFIGNRYTIVIMLFFVGYIVFEVPSNLLVRKIGPAKLLPTIAVLWGAVVLGIAFIDTWQQLAALRAILGVFEAGLFPGCTYLISCWYTRREMQLRLAAFYLMSSLAAGFSPILSYGLSTLHGKHGLEGWRWIFLVEGVITIGLGLIAYPLIVDFPDKNKFLTDEQTALVKARIDADRGDAVYDPITLEKCLKYAMDLKIWLFGIMFACATVTSYAWSSFLPIILAGFGKSPSQSQLLASPPYVVAVFVSLTLAYCADKYRHRYLFIIAQSMISIVGLVITAYAKNNDARYFGVFMGLTGCTANTPATLAYASTNIVGQSKRAFMNAIVVAFGGVGGIISSLIMRSKDSPKYLPGLWGNIGFQFLNILLVLGLTFYFKTENKRARDGRRGPIEGTHGFFFSP